MILAHRVRDGQADSHLSLRDTRSNIPECWFTMNPARIFCLTLMFCTEAPSDPFEIKEPSRLSLDTATAAHGTTFASDLPLILIESEVQAGALVPRRRGRNGCRRDPGTSGSADVDMPRSVTSFRHCVTVTMEDVSRFAPGGEPLWQAAQYSNVSKAVAAYKHSVCAAQSLQECDICWVIQWDVPGATIAYSAGVLLSIA